MTFANQEWKRGTKSSSSILLNEIFLSFAKMAQEATKRPSNADFYGPLKLSLHFRPFQTFLKCTQNLAPSIHPVRSVLPTMSICLSACLISKLLCLSIFIIVVLSLSLFYSFQGVEVCGCVYECDIRVALKNKCFLSDFFLLLSSLLLLHGSGISWCW